MHTVKFEEAVLRELNLYPLWKRRVVHGSAQEFGPAQQAVAVQPEIQPGTARGREQPVSELGWPELKAMVKDCTACGLRAGCTQTVFGVGDEKAEWLFVGEGPGADEDAQGEPFVGQAGKLLDNMLAAIKLKRGKNTYIANIVKCRPPGNRAPEADEIASCLPYLQRQVELIQPRIIVALGKTAATSLLGLTEMPAGLQAATAIKKEATLASLRGALHHYRWTSSAGDAQDIPLIITYHPAYLLRTPLDKAKAWQDLCLAVETVSRLAQEIKRGAD